MTLLELRKKIQARRSYTCKRGHWKKYGTGWNKPKGIHSKLRQHWKSRGKYPSTGDGSPAEVRGLNPKGFNDVRISNPAQLQALNPKTDAVLIASSVGFKKRQIILKKADELKLEVSNR
ncbi:MAG: eL32 family ribosomal protein [archaeon]